MSRFLRLKIWLKIIHRKIKDLFQSNFAYLKADKKLPFEIKSHKSLLIRESNGSDIQLQYNKIENLNLAITKLDGLIISPGELFSFWQLVGVPTSKRGFKEGLFLSADGLASVTGGGLCQLSNMIYWLVLHTPMTITERHRHAFDFAPDFKREVPFGVGATILYNFQDLRFRNESKYTFQLLFTIKDGFLKGEIRSSERLDTSYSIIERDHKIENLRGEYFRSNKIFRSSLSDGRSELLLTNHCKMLYEPV